MMAQLLSPNPPPAGRISQLLPTVKCSNCNWPVPLAELGDHTCSTPPAVPTLPQPAVAPSAISSLLPERFQNRVVTSPSTTTVSSPPRAIPPENRPQSQTIQQRLRASSNARPRINTVSPGPASPSSYQSRPSPLSRLADPDRTRSSSPGPSPIVSRTPVKESYTPTASSSLRTQPLPSQPHSQPQPPPNHYNNDLRSRAVSNASTITPNSNNAAPLNPRPTFAVVNRDPPLAHVRQQPSQTQGPPPPREMSYSPHVPENIDTKSGGEAGMAGVGRRGFAAAARAAMFVAPSGMGPGVSRGHELYPHGQSPQPGLRANAPRYLDIDAASRSTTTPPLSAGSGYSSHSPGPLSPFPPSPRSPHSPGSSLPSHDASRKASSHPSRTPSPNVHGIPVPPASPAPTTPLPPPPTMGAVDIPPKTPSTPLSSVRLPFFEKFKNKLPGVNTTPTTANIEIESENSGIPAIPTAPLRVSSRASSSKLYKSSSSASSSTSGSAPARSVSNSTASTSSSRGASRPTPQAPMSPSSGSEYGLAYADSTDYEDNDRDGTRTTTPPPLPGSILRSPPMKPDDRARERFPSLASERSGIRISKALDHMRGTSVSSYASEAIDPRDGTRSRSASASASEASDSAAIAQALGSSKRLPSGHGRTGGARATRSTSGSSSGSGGSRSAYSRGSAGGSVINGGAIGLERMEALETLPEDDSLVLGAADGGDKDPSNKSHRSNTVQVPYSPDARAVKLPMRSNTSPAADRDKKLEAAGTGGVVEGKRVRMRRPKECVRCQKCIDDGRWVQVDGGGILCEKCWKGMYLPKCRRCNLPIEKQAVSSSDGQLKGKYHRECFNCHTCHKPFPDKTFYVFDGKPLCAYHYHEANDSLCAAAHCGQPIEGPCAVSHTGDRYHPEHLTCEYAGYPECHERLEEYWEVDGRMLCERHSRVDEEDLGSGREESARAMKRKTRFIDLAGLSMGAPPAPVEGNGHGQELGASELR